MKGNADEGDEDLKGRSLGPPPPSCSPFPPPPSSSLSFPTAAFISTNTFTTPKTFPFGPLSQLKKLPKKKMIFPSATALALGALALLPSSLAHFTLEYPPTRGFDEDLEPNVCKLPILTSYLSLLFLYLRRAREEREQSEVKDQTLTSLRSNPSLPSSRSVVVSPLPVPSGLPSLSPTPQWLSPLITPLRLVGFLFPFPSQPTQNQN